MCIRLIDRTAEIDGLAHHDTGNRFSKAKVLPGVIFDDHWVFRYLNSGQFRITMQEQSSNIFVREIRLNYFYLVRQSVSVDVNILYIAHGHARRDTNPELNTS